MDSPEIDKRWQEDAAEIADAYRAALAILRAVRDQSGSDIALLYCSLTPKAQGWTVVTLGRIALNLAPAVLDDEWFAREINSVNKADFTGELARELSRK